MNQTRLTAGDIFTSPTVCGGTAMLCERVWYSNNKMWAQIIRPDGRGECRQIEQPTEFRVVKRMKRVIQWVPV